MAERDIPTQRALAGTMDMTESQLSKLLAKGNWSWPIIGRFCRALDCQPGDLMEYLPDT